MYKGEREKREERREKREERRGLRDVSGAKRGRGISY